MKRTFLWCRAWWWCRPSFPFERFENLEGPALDEAFEACAREWHAKNPERFASGMETLERRYFGHSGVVPPESVRATDGRVPTFDEVAVIAEWRIGKGAVVNSATRHVTFRAARPSARTYVYATEGVQPADLIVRVLRERLPMLPPGTSVERADGILRFGTMRDSNLSPTERVVVARALADLREGVTEASKWALRIADEAARIQTELGIDRQPLSDDARAMYEILCGLPETEGRRAKQLVAALLPRFPGIDEDRIRRLAQELEPYGIERTGAAGYYVPTSRRPASRRT